MGKAYSQDLRERVMVAVRRGASRRAAAAQFSISASSAIKWDQRFRETGSAQAKSLKGKSRSPLEAYAAWLLALNVAEPDLTLGEIRDRIEQAHAITPAVSALWRFFSRHKISFKKNHSRQRAKAA
jgi:transposase